MNCGWCVVGMKSESNNSLVIGGEWVFGEWGRSRSRGSSKFVEGNGLVS